MKIALFGIGTVGSDVYQLLQKDGQLKADKIYVRPGKEDPAMGKTSDVQEILQDERIGAVAEMMGGLDPAYHHLQASIAAGKHAVTANKQLVSVYGIQLAQQAAEKGVAFLFSAACGGGLPFLSNIAQARRSDTILRIGGVLNATTNFILDAMQKDGGDYSVALRQAQEMGFAELDPSDDVQGRDTARKCILACGVAFDRLPSEESMEIEGITDLTLQDVAWFTERGLTCRLAASAGMLQGRLYAYVQPALFDASAPESSLCGANSLAWYEGEACDCCYLLSRAKKNPTASAVVRDLKDAAAGTLKAHLRPECQAVAADNSLPLHSYYMRLQGDGCSLPEGWAQESWHGDGSCSCVTRPIAVAEMHRLAKQLRQQGNHVFFAALPQK